MAAINWIRWEITYISASIHNSNEISTAIYIFSGLGITTRQLWRLPDVRISGNLKMAVNNRKRTLYNVYLEFYK